MMNLNMFGIPHSGADICGFYESDNKADKLDEELCLRWIQLATFFPLARHSQAFTNE
jgi:maltase-glucoamylase